MKRATGPPDTRWCSQAPTCRSHGLVPVAPETAESAALPDPSPRPIDFTRRSLPPPIRDGRTCTVLDLTEFFGEATGGVRSYLEAKARYVRTRPDLGQVLVVPGAADDVTETSGVRCYRLQGPRIPFDPAYRLLCGAGSVRRIVQHERPDLIELGSLWLAPWLARLANRRQRIPTVWFYHTHLPALVAPPAARLGRRVLAEAAWGHIRRIAARCRAVLVASDRVANELEERGIPRIRRVTLGVDIGHFHPGRRARAAEIRRRFGLGEGPLALYLGRFAGEKQIHVVLGAWGEVQRRTGATLVLAGGGPAEPGLRAMADGLKVRWLPFQRDRERVASLLAAVDLYLAPGPAETFGLSALEAMASGTPVLSVDAGPVADRVRASGAGALYGVGDPGACAAEAIALLQSDGEGPGRAGRAWAERHHDESAACAALFATYRSLLTGAEG